MKIFTWNVNSIRIRQKQLIQLIAEEKPDVICLQETKSTNNDFPKKNFEGLGYYVYLNGMPSYNGVAILSKYKAEQISQKDFCGKKDSRHIEIIFKDIRFHSIYVPAGGDIPDPKKNEKFNHKLNFLDEMKNFFFNKDTNILAGDFNIAPYEDDVWSHKQLSNVVSHTEIERKKLVDVLKHCEFIDTTRKFISSPNNLFTWWSYRSPNFLVNNRGRRLDHIWINNPKKMEFKNAKIFNKYRELEKPSDHVPVSFEINV